MIKYRNYLPHLDGGLFLTDVGIEASLIFHDGSVLPLFAAFDLLRDEAGKDAFRNYYRPYASIARNDGVGFILGQMKSSRELFEKSRPLRDRRHG